ncbi:MAG: hypothetical protein EPN82_08390 [Bacteroidetes bacterium]|nr:MAG: hypothetical protein EPN82_08390 [Bacteroidota bacterium]
MKRIYIIILLVCLSSFGIAKETNIMLSPFIGYYIPIGGGSSSYEGTYGFQGQIEIRTNEYTGIDFTFGYVQWSLSTKEIISLMLGTRFYWFKKGPTPYTGLDVGLFNYNHQFYGISDSHSKFGFSVLQGVLLPFSNNFLFNSNIELTYFYNSLSPYSYITINAGVSFLF